VHIPRITLHFNKGQLGCTMQRHQIPVRPAFSMTAHKVQGQTFVYVGVDLYEHQFLCTECCTSLFHEYKSTVI